MDGDEGVTGPAVEEMEQPVGPFPEEGVAHEPGQDEAYTPSIAPEGERDWPFGPDIVIDLEEEPLVAA